MIAASCQTSDQLRNPDWDLLLNSIPGSHFEQTSGWGAVKARYGWQVRRILASADGKLIGGVQVLTRRIGRLGTIGYVPRGPSALPAYEGLDRQLAAEVGKIASKEWWLYCLFDYPYESHALATDMAAFGYSRHIPGRLMTATSMVDLRPNEESIIAKMNTSVRRNIRRAERSALKFELGGFSDLPRFRDLMLATCARQKVAPNPPQPDYFQHLWAELATKGWFRLFFVSYDDKIVSAALAFTISDTIRVWKVGWSGVHADKNPNHFMWWEIMRWAKANGFCALDFVWIDTEDAKRAARGELSPEGFKEGTTYFKLGFGGTLHFLPPAQCCIFHPLYRLLYNCGGSQLLGSKLFQPIASRYLSHMRAPPPKPG